METMSHRGKSIALLAFALSVVGSLNTPAIAVPPTTTTNSIEKSQPASLQAQGATGQDATGQDATGQDATGQDATGQQAAPAAAPAATPGSLVGQCRAAKERIFVYSQRSTTSQTVRTLALNERVTLADNGSAGWIAISAPVTGYVQAANLKLCQGQGNDGNTGANACRTAIVGLIVRQGPSGGTPIVGSVNAQQTVRLANPQQSQVDTTGRTWVSIVAPRTGWISSGFPEGNLGPRFNCQ